mgnify:CR=1 FL=1
MLREGRKFLDAVVVRGLPFMSAHFKRFPNEITSLLRSLQPATRTIQAICGDAKASLDKNLTALVPPTKKCLERLIFKVKGLLKSNKSVNAFWLGESTLSLLPPWYSWKKLSTCPRLSANLSSLLTGNLKHKSVQGQEVASQSLESDSEGDEYLMGVYPLRVFLVLLRGEPLW